MSMPETRPAVSAKAHGVSPEYMAYLRQQRMQKWLVFATQVMLVIGFLCVWEYAARRHIVNPFLTSYPSAVWATLVADGQAAMILQHSWVTIVETVVGFLLGMLLGLVVAIIMFWSPFISRVSDPFIVIANALPKIALVPIFYIWLGDTMSIYAMAIAISVFVTITMVSSGFQEVNPDKIKLLITFGANRWQVLTKVILPGSLPTIIAALKVNVGLALVGVIVGEFQSARAGLGYLIQYGSQIFQMNLVMLGVVILAIVSTVLYFIVQFIEQKTVKWKS